MRAICLFDRFGFREDLSLHDPSDCFSAPDTLPMKLIIDGETRQRTLQILSGSDCASSEFCLLYRCLKSTGGEEMNRLFELSKSEREDRRSCVVRLKQMDPKSESKRRALQERCLTRSRSRIQSDRVPG